MPQTVCKEKQHTADPTDKAALEQHVRRAVYQGGHVWGQALVPAPTLPSPTDWGWIKTSGVYEPLWTMLD